MLLGRRSIAPAKGCKKRLMRWRMLLKVRIAAEAISLILLQSSAFHDGGLIGG